MQEPQHVGRLPAVPVGRASKLVVSFCGERRFVEPDQRLVFGRSPRVDGSDLACDLDTNPWLAPESGVLRHETQGWFVERLGSSAVVTLTESRRAELLTPGATDALTARSTIIEVTAAGARYALEVLVSGLPEAVPDLAPATSDDVPVRLEEILSHRQYVALVALCESALRVGPDEWWGAAPVPSHKQLSARLEIPEAALRRRLDEVCQKLRASGVAGLTGGKRMATLRNHVIGHGLLDPNRLGLLA